MTKIVIRDIFSWSRCWISKRSSSFFMVVFHFYLKKIKLKNAISFVCSTHDKEKYVVHIRALKQALNYRLILKKYIKQFKLRTEAKNEFEKDFFKLTNNSAFGKTMENVRKHRNIKLVTTGKRRNQLASEPNYHTTK